MFSKEEILAQLRNGADASDIAQKMADTINEAVREYDAEAEKAKARDAERLEDARKVTRVMADYFAKWMGEDKMTEAEIDEAAQAMIELSDTLTDLKDALGGIAKTGIPIPLDKVKGSDRAPAAEEEIDDDVLRRFLASL